MEPRGHRGRAPRSTEIRHLAALVAVGRERSFRAAATRLGWGRSALSQHIAELERVMGARLIERSPGVGRARLTEAGRLLLAHAEAVMARLDAARADIQALADQGPLRVGVYEAIAARVIPALVEGVQFRASEASAEAELLDRLTRGQLDLAFAALPLPGEAFRWVVLLEEPFVLLAPAGSDLAKQLVPPTIAELAGVPLIARDGWRLEPQLRFVQRAGSDASARALVAAGLGCAILPRLSVEPADPATVAMDLSTVLAPRTLALAWRRDRRLSEVAARFRDAAVEVCRGIESATWLPR